MKIRFYGRLGDRLGQEVIVDLLPGAETVAELRELLVGMFPHASSDLRQRSRACVADAFVLDDYRLGGAETVEFMPPLSGG